MRIRSNVIVNVTLLFIIEYILIEEEASEVLHLEHSFIWCWNLTLRAVDQKHLGSFEMWCWRRMEKIIWTDHVRNEDVLLRVKEQRNIYLSFRSCDSCRRLPERKHHSFLFNHWSASKCLVFMAARTPSIHVFLGRPLFFFPLVCRGISYMKYVKGR